MDKEFSILSRNIRKQKYRINNCITKHTYLFKALDIKKNDELLNIYKYNLMNCINNTINNNNNNYNN